MLVVAGVFAEAYHMSQFRSLSISGSTSLGSGLDGVVLRGSASLGD